MHIRNHVKQWCYEYELLQSLTQVVYNIKDRNFPKKVTVKNEVRTEIACKVQKETEEGVLEYALSTQEDFTKKLVLELSDA